HNDDAAQPAGVALQGNPEGLPRVAAPAARRAVRGACPDGSDARGEGPPEARLVRLMRQAAAVELRARRQDDGVRVDLRDVTLDDEYVPAHASLPVDTRGRRPQPPEFWPVDAHDSARDPCRLAGRGPQHGSL